MKELLLPLFPLQVVLFPRTALPLHIFEERYKQMIAECLENQCEFGVVLVRERSLENAGCTASISEVVRRYDDGRMDILVRGCRRFEILLLDQEKPYLRAAPQFFEDEEAVEPAADDRRQQAVHLYRQAMEILHREDSDPLEQKPDLSASQLSYQLMARLPADLEFKQVLLRMRSENQRLTEAISYLQKLLKHLVLVARTRTMAGGNGRCR